MHDKHDSTQDESALAIGTDKRPGFARSSVASVGIEVGTLTGVT